MRPEHAHCALRFVTGTGTGTDSVAAPKSKAPPETLRASTRTVLLDQTAASSSTKRVDGHVDEVDGAAGERREVERGFGRELPHADRHGRRAGERRRRRLRWAVEPERLQLDLAVQAHDADLRRRRGPPSAPSSGGSARLRT